MTTYLGIDPGKGGALAAFRDGEPVEWAAMPVAGKEIDWAAVGAWVQSTYMAAFDGLAVVERVHAMPKQGVSSTFKFGMAFGGILGVLAAYDVPVELVTPQRWKAAILRDTKKDKAAAIDYCRRRWPSVSLLATERSRKPHDGIADALCLGAYACEIGAARLGRVASV